MLPTVLCSKKERNHVFSSKKSGRTTTCFFKWTIFFRRSGDWTNPIWKMCSSNWISFLGEKPNSQVFLPFPTSVLGHALLHLENEPVSTKKKGGNESETVDSWAQMTLSFGGVDLQKIEVIGGYIYLDLPFVCTMCTFSPKKLPNGRILQKIQVYIGWDIPRTPMTSIFWRSTPTYQGSFGFQVHIGVPRHDPIVIWPVIFEGAPCLPTRNESRWMCALHLLFHWLPWEENFAHRI